MCVATSFIIGGRQRITWLDSTLFLMILNYVSLDAALMNQHIIFSSIILFLVLFDNLLIFTKGGN